MESAMTKEELAAHFPEQSDRIRAMADPFLKADGRIIDRQQSEASAMPTSFKLRGDERVVIDNRTGRVITDAVSAQTSAITGPSYTVERRGIFGRAVTKTVRADIRIESALQRSTAAHTASWIGA
ncbi:MAG: hypothetical protein DI624_04050 [Brevundimonas sp.]|nr:MAG: hypothetical protein DI624_04050 [Brevundimonas sp.]